MLPQLPPPFPVRWPREYRKAALALGPGSPLLRMGDLHPSETFPDVEGSADPTGETRFRPLPFLVRKHWNRALVLSASRCFFYCRFCFRRGLPSGSLDEAGPRDWEEIAAWFGRHPEVTEAILSGGDPLTLSDERLRAIARTLGSVPHLQRWRIHTRAPVTFPERVSESLIAALGSPLPLRVVIHVNHPAEIRPAFLRALERFRRAGVPVLNQSVLLAGVNDDAAVLTELFGRLREEDVALHYLHHPDRAPGNGRFRLTVEQGLRVYRELRRTSLAASEGTSIPPYVLDLPCGAGKCPVESLLPVARERTSRGSRVRYRWVRPHGWDSLALDEACEFWDTFGSSATRESGPSTEAPANSARPRDRV